MCGVSSPDRQGFVFRGELRVSSVDELEIRRVVLGAVCHHAVDLGPRRVLALLLGGSHVR